MLAPLELALVPFNVLFTPSHHPFPSVLPPVPSGNYPRNIFELLPRNPLTEVKQEGVCMLKDEAGDYFVGLVPGKPYEVINDTAAIHHCFSYY